MVGYCSLIHQIFSEQWLCARSLGLGSGSSSEQAHKASAFTELQPGGAQWSEFKCSELTAGEGCILKESVTRVLAWSTRGTPKRSR